jgi:hypothetical protein
MWTPLHRTSRGEKEEKRHSGRGEGHGHRPNRSDCEREEERRSDRREGREHRSREEERTRWLKRGDVDTVQGRRKDTVTERRDVVTAPTDQITVMKEKRKTMVTEKTDVGTSAAKQPNRSTTFEATPSG